ncbi:MFS transporter [Pseudarthrobacter sp. S6]|uniref:MFS transporter n=1 Tax=Pseudarthrobacter sp. S6 TaxID=3418420 RepID=UPI003CF712FE
MGRGFVILALTVTFLAFQEGAISPVSWLVLSEIRPLKIRGLGRGASAFLVWTVDFMVGFGFPQLLAAIGLSSPFFVFAVLGVGAIVLLPRTFRKQRTRDWKTCSTTSRMLPATKPWLAAQPPDLPCRRGPDTGIPDLITSKHPNVRTNY